MIYIYTYIYIYIYMGAARGTCGAGLIYSGAAPRRMRGGLYIQRCGHSGACRVGLIYSGVGLIYSADYAYSIFTHVLPHVYREQTHSLHLFTLIQCFC